MLRISTEQCVLRDASKPGGVRLSPRAEPFLSKMKAKGLITYRRAKDGWLVVELAKGKKTK